MVQSWLRQMDTDATSAELAKALGKLKNGKAPGSSNVLPEMLNLGVYGMIADLVHRIWDPKNGSIPSSSLSLRKAI